MSYSISDFKNNKVIAKDIFLEEIEKAKMINDANWYTFLFEEAKEINKKSLLSGATFFIKDNIWTKGYKTTASSNILKNFIPAEDATVVNLLKENGAIPLGKTVLDELGMGGTGLHACTGPVYNPFDKTRIIGGSSSGSAFALANEIGAFALGTDTGDSIRKPASQAGLYGFKPSYGSVSRYGVIPYAPSLDHVGFFTKNIDDLFYLAEATFKYDKKDFTSIDNSKKYSELINKKTSFKKVGYFSCLKNYISDSLWRKYEEVFESLKKQSYEIIEIDFRKDLLDSIASIYMMISFSEAVSTSANLDGINFGIREDGINFEQVMKKTRGKNFGELVKKRFIMGSYQLKKENQVELLLKAKKVRRLICNELKEIYEEVDFIILPPTYEKPKLIKDVHNKTLEDYAQDEKEFLDNLLVLANFNGMPSITIPFVKSDGMPIGININANVKKDDELLMFSKDLDNLIQNMLERNI